MTYEEAQTAVHADPDNAGAWFILGALEETAGLAVRASDSYRRALELDPLLAEARAALKRLQEERVLERARDSTANEGFEAASLSDGTARRAPVRLLLLVLLTLGLAALLYLNFRGLTVTPSDAAIGEIATVPIATATTGREAQRGVSDVRAATTPRSLLTASPTPSATPSATTTVLSAAALLERVATAKAELRSGHFQATTRFSADTHSSAEVRFDLGRGGETPRLHLITTYDAPQSSQTMEYVIIGVRAWQRVEGEAWVEMVEQEGVPGRIRRYLPQNERVTVAMVQVNGERAQLRWRDSSRGLEVTLQVDSTTAIPLELSEGQTGGGTVTIVRYVEWNTPVEIEPPL